MRTWREYDHIREIKNSLLGKYPSQLMYQTHDREYRYEERDTAYSLKCWHDGAETIIRGDLDTRPEWLERIITAATVGGHLKRMFDPPPDAIVWFTTDLDNNLLTFLELT
jgi:hypothetical protein